MSIFKCSCGKTHAVTNRKKIIEINGKIWDINCYLTKINEEYQQLIQETMKSRLLFVEIKRMYPEVDFDKCIENIQNLEVKDA